MKLLIIRHGDPNYEQDCLTPVGKEEAKLLEMIKDSHGRDRIVIYCAKEKAMKPLPSKYDVQAERKLIGKLAEYFGQDRVKVVEKAIEKM